ncbi:hypothetical protein SprV_0301113900 [Sparganum proliferum]
MWFHVAEPCSAATPRATASTGGLTQVRALCALCGVHSVLQTPQDGWSDGTLRRHRRDEAPSVEFGSDELAQRLDNLPIAAVVAADPAAAAENASLENRWCQLRDTVQSTALAVLGLARRQHQDWFDENDAVISSLFAETNRLHKAYVDHPTDDNRAAFYRTVYGPRTKGTAPLLSADGSTLLTEKTQILQRWAEHFRDVLNRPSTITDAAIARLLQVETNVDLDFPPSLQETVRAVHQLSSGKAPRSDAIPAEVYKHGGSQLMDHLTALFQEMWRQGEVPQDFKDATIVHLYKRKGNRQFCGNHRGISLLKIAGKIFARILLNRLNNHLEQGLLPESQCGFRRHRGTTDMNFAARQLQEECQEMRTHLYSTFVDLTEAFDTVNREGLWKIMRKFGCPERFIEMVRQLHDGMIARVTDKGVVSEAFAVTDGVNQGCVLAPTLFSLMFSAMLMDAYRDERPPPPTQATSVKKEHSRIEVVLCRGTNLFLILERTDFWQHAPELYFFRIEATFHSARITRETDKYYKLVESLPPTILSQVQTFLRDPLTDAPYTKLKAELLRLTSVSDRQRYHTLVKEEALGDRKPSELLRRMRSFVGNMTIGDKFFKEMFLERLPTSGQTILASGSDDLDISKLAEMVDRMMEVVRLSSPTIAQVSQPLTVSTSDLAELKTQIAQLSATVAALQPRRSPGPSRRSFGRDRRRSRSRPRTANLCCIMSTMDFAGALFSKAVFLKIDLVRAFHQIPVAPEDIPKTAVTTPFGLFEFIIMSFGLRNAAQAFQRFIDHVLRGLPFVYAYIDDFLVASRNEEERKEHLALVFDRLDKFGVVVHPSKCVLGVPSLEFLRHQVDSECLRPLPSKVEPVRNFPPPTSKRQLQRFLGMVNFYRRLLSNCADLMLPLTNMLSGPKGPLELTGDALTAFERIKNSLADATFLTHPAPEAQLSLMVDTSTVAVGAVLQQHLAGSTRPLAFFSKKPNQLRHATVPLAVNYLPLTWL